jgi:hypothetical protein
MKAFKIFGLVIWGLITIGLLFYGSSMKQQAEVQKKLIDELIVEMSDLLDSTNVGTMVMEFTTEIDSLENEIQQRDSLILMLKKE